MKNDETVEGPRSKVEGRTGGKAEGGGKIQNPEAKIQRNGRGSRSRGTGRGRERGGFPDALAAVLERFHISRAAFEGLRSDSYEKHLAKRSLAELESVYLTLLKPGEASAELQKKFPRWDEDGKHAGKLPSLRTLTVIKRRIMAEHTVDSLGTNEQFLKVFQARAKGLSAKRQAALYDTILELLGNELIAAMLEGKPLLGNLKGVDRIMKAKAMGTRAEQGERRLKIREGGLRIRAEQLEWQRQQRQKADEGRGSRVEGQTKALSGRGTRDEGQAEALSGDNETEAEEEYDPEAMDETDIMMEKVFGKNPFNQRDAGPTLKTSTTESVIDSTGPN